MDKIAKALKKLNPKERRNIRNILLSIQKDSIKNFDIKRLKGHNDIFRIRKGSLRIIYKIDKNKQIKILAIERRSEKTYKF